MSLTRTVLATVFVAWPILMLIRCMGICHRPLTWLADRISHRLGDLIRSCYVTVGLKLYYWTVYALEGREQAELAVLYAILESMATR